MTTPFGSSLATTVNLSGNSTLDSLLTGTKWASGVITYSFATSSSVWSTDFFTGYGTASWGREPYKGYGTLSSLDQTFTKLALSSWSNVSNLTFTQVADNASTVGDIRFAYSSLLSGAQAWAYSPGSAAIAGDVWFNSNGTSNYYTWTQGSYEFLTVIHELGHALGLDHPFSEAGKITAALPQDQDYLWNTVMSYSAQPGQTSAYLDFYPTTPMGIDIQTMQYLYGANTSYHAGNDTYTFLQGSHYLQTIWDAGGIDTIKYIATYSGCEIDLRPGEWSQLGLGVGIYNAGRFVRTEYDTVNIYDTVIIENAIGSDFSDKIYGNLAGNNLSGGGGNDTLDGGSGADILNGGAGADIMTGGLGNDSIDGSTGSDMYIIASAAEHTQAEFSDSGTSGTDEVRFTATDTLGGSTLTLYAGDTGIERVVIGAGTATTAILTDTVALNIYATTLLNALTITGNAGNNTLAGTSFNDTVNGGAGADIMTGGLGNDSIDGSTGSDMYIIASVAEHTQAEFSDSGTSGTDEVRFTATDTLGGSTLTLYAGDTGIERVVIGTGIATTAISTGTVALNIDATALLSALTITGNAGNNTLTGTNFNDTVNGGDGDDILNGSFGVDTLDGGSGADTLNGGYGNDILTGGLGNDSLDGGTGSDMYIIASATEHTQAEFSDSGNIYYTDEVSFTATDTLGGSTLTLYAGDTGIERVSIGTNSLSIFGETTSLNVDAMALLNAVIITGNAGANTLTGSSFNDTLDGGAGADKMIGGAGDDIYIVDNALDTVTEVDGEGIDSIQSSITYSLVDTDGAGGNGGNVENLTLTGFMSIDATGNTLDNVLIGNSSANTLTGDLGNDTLDGGEGADNMVGGIGDDTYFVDNALDIVTETDAEGNDTVKSSVTYSLANGAYIENLTLTGAANINATGNALNNIIIGNDGANIIAGNLGDDTMIGGDGNDIYIVDSTLDIITETNSVQLTGGVDEAQSSSTYTLGLNIEKLTLTGSDHINGTGNSLNNTIVGNAGNNSLDGSTGIDTLQGGLGNDIYTVDLVQTGASATTYSVALQDTIIEAIDAGNDSLILRGNFNHITASTITLTAAVENLDASQTGRTKLNLTGNALNNNIIGNSAANVISGGKGDDILNGLAGIDTLTGGLGNDTYYVNIIQAGADAAVLEDVVTELSTAGSGTDTLILQDTLSLTNATTLILADTLEHLDASATADTKLNLSGNDASNTLTGNAADNRLFGLIGNDTLIGNAGNDVLNGGVGIDTLKGGAGNDTYVIDNIADIIDEEANLDTSDTVKYDINASAILTSTLTIGSSNTNEVKLTALTSASLDLTQIENLIIRGTGKYNLVGNDADNILTGNASANSIIGGAGNDTLNGGAGLDTLNGGDGNDEYFVDSVAEVNLITDSSGIDTLNISFTYTLTDPLENLTLIGITEVNGTGNSADNILKGNDAANILDGKAGADTLNGGKGNDTYLIDNVSDTVTETLTLAQSGGIDTVRISAGYNGTSRTAEDNIDNIDASLFANGIHLTGNDLANNLKGGAGDDTLYGGLGNDVLKGGLGNDTYTVDLVQTGTTAATYSVALQDTITEAINAGNDSLILRGNFDHLNATTLTLASTLENLDASLTGSTKLNLTGNALNNRLTGNDASNILNSGAGADTLDGGAGSDIMIGGDGNDTYIVDNTLDVTNETNNLLAGGIDEVQSSISWMLGTNLENLILTGSSHVNATGNALDNTVTGNAGNNILSGALGNDTLSGGNGDDTLDGGIGADIMVGGAGNDTYIVDNVGDVITESSLALKIVSNTNGGEANDGSGQGTFSANGRYLVFSSEASNLVSGDNNGKQDIFIKDLQTGTIQLVSVATDGMQGDGKSSSASISADGRYVTFESESTNLVTGDVNSLRDIFIKDLQTGIVQLVSISDTGVQGNSISSTPSISPDGSFVLFESWANNLVAGTIAFDIYIKDMQMGAIKFASTSSAGEQGNTNFASRGAALSATGRYVVFESTSSNLVAGDNNYEADIFIKDLQTGAVQLVSVNANGNHIGTGTAGKLSVSADGRYVVFQSSVDNLELETSAHSTFNNNIDDGILVKDMQTGILQHVSTDANGIMANSLSNEASISQDGRFVVFTSYADNLVDGDNNGAADVFIKDVQTGAIKLISTSHTGTQGNNGSYGASFSADGHHVLFTSYADNLVDGDNNGAADVFLVVNPFLQNVTEVDIDIVKSSISYTLGANVEGLELTGIADINGTGNELNNTIIGNAGNNTLHGDAGNDCIDGIAGYDNIYGDAGDDTLTGNGSLNGGVGNDTLIGTGVSSPAGNTLNGMDGNDTLIGCNSGVAEILVGGAGSDFLDGGGGLLNYLNGGVGDDTLIIGDGVDWATGDAGADIFLFNAITGGIGLICDFSSVAGDSLVLSQAAMSSLGNSGTLDESNFESGADITAATTASGYIVYDTTLGNLYYDSDGFGGAASVLIATLDYTPMLTASDIHFTN